MSDSDESKTIDERAKRAQVPRDDLEARNLRAQVQQRLFGGPTQPLKIGRYDVLERVGSGGLGVVYAAHDPELDRHVAIKVLQPQAGHSSGTAEAHARLVREAQAMAQLSHPNVIQVYEVGTFDEDVYIAMELVDGEPLAEWMHAPGRDWREVLERFIDAGRGLAAAHDAGLVHRDFKPANVLVDRSGRVRVLDFGLAKLSGAPSAEQRWPSTSGSGRGIASVLTEHGSLVGTPAYMSPEQHQGAEADPKSDQYSFCVALWEGLCGQRPFAGNTVEELIANKSAQRFNTSDGATARTIPTWVRRIVARGMSLAPADRFDSMHELLAALEHDPVRVRRRRVGLIAGSLAIAGMILAGFSLGRSRADACDKIADQLATVWDASARGAVEHAFAASDRAYAASLGPKVTGRIDTYAERWLELRTQTCEEMNADATAALLDRQLCLDHRLRDLAELTLLLGSGDADIIEHAVEAVEQLPQLDLCDQADGLAQGLAADAKVRTQIGEIEGKLARGRALRVAARYAEAVALALEVKREADKLGYGHAVVEAGLLEGSVLHYEGKLQEAESVLDAALRQAEELGMDAAATRILIQLVWTVGINGGRHDEGERLVRLAEAKLARSGSPPALEASLRHTLGTMLQQKGEYEGARAALERALERRRGGEDPLRLASTFNSLGVLHGSMGDFGEAARYFERALALYADHLSMEHPMAAMALGNLGTAMLHNERPAEAQVHLERSLVIVDRELGEDHPTAASLRVSLGLCHLEQDDPRGALAVFERALAVGTQALGEDHPMIAKVRVNIANAHRDLGQLDEAFTLGTRALDDYLRVTGEDHPEMALAHLSLAATLIQRGDPVGARKHLLRGLVLRETALGPDNRGVAEVLVDLAELDLQTGRGGNTVARLERALGILDQNVPADRELFARATALLARAREH